MTDNIDRCTCGKPRAEIHCPTCASTNYVALPSKAIKTVDADGNAVTLRVWRCRRCGEVFDEFKWKNRCVAPARARARSSRSSAITRATASLDENDLFAKANAYREHLGLAPLTREEFDANADAR